MRPLLRAYSAHAPLTLPPPCSLLLSPGSHLPQLCLIHGDMKRAILGLSFSATGEFLAAIGNDNNRSIGFYRWKKDTPLEKMRIGVDKGHSDDVYQLCYNPVTDHAVAGGKKFLRFFGLKEGAMNNVQRAEFEANGYIVIPDCLNSQQVDELNAEYDLVSMPHTTKDPIEVLASAYASIRIMGHVIVQFKVVWAVVKDFA